MTQPAFPQPDLPQPVSPQPALPQSAFPQTPLCTAEEVAAYLQLSPETVRNMARSGIIPSIKVGKRAWRFKAEIIQDWLKQKHDVSDD